jgi:CheY-like chemotaxis protein
MTAPSLSSTSITYDTTDPAAQRSQAVILYAEDNEINVMLVAQILEMRPQWRLEIARSGEEALEMVGRVQPDLALIDMNLGDMSGLVFLTRLQSAGRADGLIKVALSADALASQIDLARQAGFDDYLTKPLDVEVLLERLDQYLSAV